MARSPSKERIALDIFLKASQRVQQEAMAGKDNVAAAPKNDPRLDLTASGGWRSRPWPLGRDWPGRDGAAVPPHSRIARRALLAVRDELRALDEHASDPERLATPFDKGTHGCRFAIPMIRNGMLTDQARDLDGKPSEFRMTESRLTKGIGKHVDRAMRNPRAGASSGPICGASCRPSRERVPSSRTTG